MCSMRNPKPVRVGIVADEPLRLDGLTRIFEQPVENGQQPLVPVIATMHELLSVASLDYLVVDLALPAAGLKTLAAVRRARPNLTLLVVGPEGNDELMMESIIGGARAYLEPSASAQAVRQAIEVVMTGSIWAPRRLLSKLVDRLLAFPDASAVNGTPHLTARERQVLDQILKARSNREIARQLGIEERTVKAHVGSLMRKTGVENRIELSMRALNLSLVNAPEDLN